MLLTRMLFGRALCFRFLNDSTPYVVISTTIEIIEEDIQIVNGWFFRIRGGSTRGVGTNDVAIDEQKVRLHFVSSRHEGFIIRLPDCHGLKLG